MDAEKQAKYKQQYTKMREEYTAKMERFYEEHPDAKPSACRSDSVILTKAWLYCGVILKCLVRPESVVTSSLRSVSVGGRLIFLILY